MPSCNQSGLEKSTEGAILKPGRALRDCEKLNFLGIGVHQSARGRGVNLAMAAYSYLQLIERGAKYLSYTLVLDDNWPSRRTAIGIASCGRSRSSRSRMLRLVTYFPSRPAKGEGLTMKFMERVGSSMAT